MYKSVPYTSGAHVFLVEQKPSRYSKMTRFLLGGVAGCLVFLTVFMIFSPSNGNALPTIHAYHNDDLDCDKILSPQLIKEIEGYQSAVDAIIHYINGTGARQTYKQLQQFVDKFGPRFAGTQHLENAIDDRVAYFKSIVGEANVHTEEFTIPQWVRGQESAKYIGDGWEKNIALLALGYSVGTPKEGITTKYVAVKSFDELKALGKDKVQGKIVVYNQDFVSYGVTVDYRSRGASEAAKLGAVAALIRSVTPFSLYTPHTGMMSYEDNVPKIPAACITVEDAEFLYRQSQDNEEMSINLYMEAHMNNDTTTRNTIAEVKGTEIPDEVVIVSGHLDSWDVGQGAMDDGGGAAISWMVPQVLKNAGLTPRRTVRSILWAAEEMGCLGGQNYFATHKQDADKIQYIMESDIGTFTPRGLTVSGADKMGRCISKKVVSLLKRINATEVEFGNDGPDIGQWFNIGVPGASLLNDNDKYFYYHHTNADTMTMMDPEALDRSTVVWASVAYIMAQLSERVPHDPVYKV